jgi:hypothetical protein
MDDTNRFVGRIAAFISSKYLNKGDEQPTGCVGFFDCINNQAAANLLFDTAKAWLMEKGMEAMDGPVNFGERDRWWGLLVEGFSQPLFGMNYNYPYYQALFENYGFQVFYNQLCFSRQMAGRLSDKFYTGHERIYSKGGFHAEHLKKNQLQKFANDFCTVYNKAWASHEGNKQMAPEQALKLFNRMKPIMDEDIVWFAYYKEEPIAFYISIPDLNEIFRYLDGQFNWWAKLKFLWYKWRGVCKRCTGIIFGVVPRFQGLGVDYFLIVEAAKIMQPMGRYLETELQWQGDFNPKMINISRNLEFKESRQLITYRYLFDRTKPFKRHPMLN